jgi:biotin carboxyl carrier protein
MHISHWLVRGIGGVCIIGALVAAYQTQAYWWPYVFPSPSSPAPEEGEKEAEQTPADRIKLSPQAQQNLGLRSATLTPRPYWRTLLIPGVVVDRPGETDLAIHTRVGGVITEITIRPGETVRPGQLLFRIELVSEFLQASQIELAKTVKELALAQVERERIARLVEGGSVASAELVRQQSQVERLTHLVQSLRRQLQLYGLQQDQIERIEKGAVETTLSLTVPLRSDVPTAQTLYEVKELKVRLGDQVSAGAHLCTLSDHRWLFIEGWAFPSEAKALTEAAENNWPVTAEFVDEEPGDWPPLEPLTIHHLGNHLDPHNRTFPFYLSLPNQARSFERNGKTYLAWRFRPGQRVRLRVPVEKLVTYGPDGMTRLDPFVLPVEAVVREGPEAYVFIQAGDLFIRKAVRVLYEDRREAVIANDRSITQAELVVLNQAAALNRALKAAQTRGSDHDHEHDH